jgi:hypothetical protein
MCTTSTAHAASSLPGAEKANTNNAAASSAPCNLTYLTGTCQSTDPSVTVSTYAHGNVSNCTFAWVFAWGDGDSSQATLGDPPDGWNVTARHSYAHPGTYTLTATGTPAGGCTLTPFTATFILTAPAPTLYTSHVRVWGLVACTDENRAPPLPGPRYEVSRVRFQAANGEAHDAKISHGFSYYVDFNHVPAGGETVFVYVTCKLDTNPSWGTNFTLTRHLVQLQYLNLIRL